MKSFSRKNQTKEVKNLKWPSLTIVTKESRLSKESGAGPDRQKENRDFVARSSHQTGPRGENKPWRHCKTECWDRGKYYEELRRQRLEEELAKEEETARLEWRQEEETARLEWESYEKVCSSFLQFFHTFFTNGFSSATVQSFA